MARQSLATTVRQFRFRTTDFHLVMQPVASGSPVRRRIQKDFEFLSAFVFERVPESNPEADFRQPCIAR